MFSAILYYLFTECMMWPLYRGDIIWYDLNPVQSSYIPVSTVLISYIDATGPISYFLSDPSSWFLRVTFVLTTSVGLLGTSNSNEKNPNRKIAEFTEHPGDNLGGEEPPESPTDEQSTSHAETGGGRQEWDHAYGYVRQSQDSEEDDDKPDDSDESTSIRRQKKNVYEVADEHEYRIAEIFVDENESGFSFNREGYNNLREQLEQDPAPVVLDRVNRFGRDTLETIFVAGQIYYEYDVPILTRVHGEYDLGTPSDQVSLVVKAIAAGQAVQDRMRATWESIHELFEEDRSWKTWFTKTPVGHQIPEANRWLEPHPYGREVVSAIMVDLCETGTYTTTIENLKNAASNQRLSPNTTQEDDLGSVDGEKIKAVFEASDYEIENFGIAQLKDLVTNAVYIGEIRYPKTAEEADQDVIEDDTLRIVDETLFDEVNDVVERIHQKGSSSGSNGVDVASLSEMGILLKSMDVIENISPVCPVCNQGMLSNGERPLSDGTTVYNWICPKYTIEGEEADRQRKVPNKKEWEALQEHMEEEYEQSEVLLLELCRFD